MMRGLACSLAVHAVLWGLSLWMVSQHATVIQPTFQWEVSLVNPPSEWKSDAQRSDAPSQQKSRVDEAVRTSMTKLAPRAPTPMISTTIGSHPPETSGMPIIPATMPQDHGAETLPLSKALSGPSQAAPMAAEQADDDRPKANPATESVHTTSYGHSDELAVGSEVPPTHTTSPSTTTPHDTVSRRADDDFNWLMSLLWNRVTDLKRYPQEARMNRWEGRVIVRVIIDERGQLLDAVVAAGSGHEVLDRAALEVIRESCPLALTQPLGRSRIVLRVPIQYKLNS